MLRTKLEEGRGGTEAPECFVKLFGGGIGGHPAGNKLPALSEEEKPPGRRRRREDKAGTCMAGGSEVSRALLSRPYGSILC